MREHLHSLGILGGTFNPVHLGHLRLAEDVREDFGLDRVLFIPTNIPPHKEMQHSASPENRLRMVEAAVGGNRGFACDDTEIRRGGRSYTIDTVCCLYRRYTFEEKPFLLIGSDLFPELHTWKDIQELARLVEFIVLVRDGYPVENGMHSGIPNLRAHLFEKRRLEIASSEIRERALKGKSIRYLVPEEVYQYIMRKGLYT
ncbi:MAG: nicotinate-nucleotide adenylyltransferase [Spirochaetota bacterium]